MSQDLDRTASSIRRYSAPGGTVASYVFDTTAYLSRVAYVATAE